MRDKHIFNQFTGNGQKKSATTGNDPYMSTMNNFANF